MATLDLDALHAEADEEGHTITVGGKSYDLPADFGLLFPEYLREGQFLKALGCLVGDDAEEVGQHLRINATTGGDLAPILALYGLELPELSASSEPSPNIGAKSRQTSEGSTGSPSKARASARKR